MIVNIQKRTNEPEAVQWKGDNADEIYEFLGGSGAIKMGLGITIMINDMDTVQQEVGFYVEKVFLKESYPTQSLESYTK